jgi:hypothetical protein
MKLIEDISTLTERINIQSIAFRYQIKILPKTLPHSLIAKIIKFENLKELSLTTNRNYSNHLINLGLDREYLMTASFLRSIYSYCQKL